MSESRLHVSVVVFMSKCCQKLELNDTTLATACVLYHKFFQSCNVEEYDLYTVAATAIYLATKVEEQHTRLRDIVNVCHRTRHPDKAHLELDSVFWKLRDTISSCELLMMRMLQFQVTYVHPHKYMLHYLMSISQLFRKKEWTRSSVGDAAWCILKDSYLDSTCLKFPPQVHAIAAIDLALQCCNVEIPLESNSDISWWKVLYSDCSYDDILNAQTSIVNNYNLNTT